MSFQREVGTFPLLYSLLQFQSQLCGNVNGTNSKYNTREKTSFIPKRITAGLQQDALF